jgi:Predicted transcriptional regulator
MDRIFVEEADKNESILYKSFFGKRMRKIREAQGISQTELGEKVGLSADRIQKYENGIRNPKEELIIKIASALDVDPLALIDPSPCSEIGAMYCFFDMEEHFDLEPIEINGEVYLHFGNRDCWNGFLKNAIQKWNDKYLEMSNIEEDISPIIKDEIHQNYDKWKWNLLSNICDTNPVETEIKQLEKTVAKLNKRIEELKNK